MDTAFTRLLGIDAPIVQAPMGGATCPALAAAVCEAGALGMLALSWHPADRAVAEIRATQALTDRPFGVNLVLAFPQEERLEACLAAGVRVVSFFWGDPAPFVARVHAAGALVTTTVASAEDARRAVDAGVDVIVAQGWEAGGHVRGEVATLPLVRAVVSAVGPEVPVLAAGGIADGAGLAAGLALGAAGAWIGTRFLAAEEAQVHPGYRRRILAADETATAYTSLFDVGWPDAPHRVLRNTTIAAWEAAGRPAPGARPGEGEVLASGGRGRFVRYTAMTPTTDTEGDIEALSLWAGQGVSGVSAVQPAREIVRQLADEARAAGRALAAALD